jgi:hypothetical protein
MQRAFELGEIIAERRLVFEASKGGTRDVCVRIGRPVLDPSAPRETWVCPFQIEGLGTGRAMGIFGIDAMQALLLAIHTIPAELAIYVRDPGGRFLHLGDTDTSFVSGCRTVLEYAGDAFPPDAV